MPESVAEVKGWIIGGVFVIGVVWIWAKLKL